MSNLNLNHAANENKYDSRTVRWLDKGDHYELIFTDDFVTPGGVEDIFASDGLGSGNVIVTDILLDMRNGIKDKEVHVFIGSFGGKVAALNMILQQLLTYEHRVGINLGTACSCGWILFFACQERYISPYCQAMYHDISCVCGGKHAQLQQNAEFMNQWQQELMKLTDTAKVLTPRELELGHTTEVWFTGKQLIERGAAKDYKEYLTRRKPVPVTVASVRDSLYLRGPAGWIRLVPAENESPKTYQDLVELANRPPTPEDMEKLLKQFQTALPEAGKKNRKKTETQRCIKKIEK